MPKKSDLALALAHLSEEATPAVLEAVLEKFWGCGREIGERKCGRSKKAHPRADCPEWVRDFGMKDGLELLDRLTEFSLHGAKVEDALGLKRKETGLPLVFMPHIDAATWKRMTDAQREAEFLKSLDAVVMDTEKIDGPVAPIE